MRSPARETAALAVALAHAVALVGGVLSPEDYVNPLAGTFTDGKPASPSAPRLCSASRSPLTPARPRGQRVQAASRRTDFCAGRAARARS